MQVTQVRIISGKWRGTRLDVPTVEGLRPTSNRVRETLFSWLLPHIEGAKVLDLFSGTGVLAFEALSRGASSALAIDKDKNAVYSIKNTIEYLECERIFQLKKVDTLHYLKKQRTVNTFDIVFLDPPFFKKMIEPICKVLEERGWLSSYSWIYIESEKTPSQLTIPSNWKLYREKKAGRVYYTLHYRIT